MKYVLELTSSIKDGESVEEKHQKVVAGLQSLPKPWGIAEGYYPAPAFGSGITATFRLNKLLHQGIKGDVIYNYRENGIEKNDRVYIQFNPEKANYLNLLESVFLKYIDFFQPFEASLFNEEIVFYDYQNRDKFSLSEFFRFYPVFFWNSDFCKKKLGISLEEFRFKVSNHIEKSFLVSDGIFVIVSSDILTLEQSNAIDVKLKSIF